MIDAFGFTAILALLSLGGSRAQVDAGAATEAFPRRTEESFTGTFQLDTLDDMDGDGVVEVLAGCPHVPTTREATGVVFVLSGRSARAVHTLLPPEGVSTFALAVTALPDLDDDGVDDFAVAARRSPELGEDPVVIAFSGKTATALWTRTLAEGGGGFAVLDEIADRDGDGCADLVVGRPGSDTESRWPGVVQVLSGDTGESLQVLRPGENAVDFGGSVTEAPDADGDGVRDLVVVARWLVDDSERGYFARLRSRRYWAGIYSGKDGTDLGRPAGTEDAEQVLGASTLGHGNLLVLEIVDAERVGAGLVGRIRARWGDEVNPAHGLVCQAATDSTVRWFIPGGDIERYCEVGDVDGDGSDEIAVGFPDRVLAGELRVFSVKRRETLFSLSGMETGDRDADAFGSGMCPVGDFDGDEVPDLCVASETYYGRHDSSPSRLFWVSVGRKRAVRFLQVDGERARVIELETN